MSEKLPRKEESQEQLRRRASRILLKARGKKDSLVMKMVERNPTGFGKLLKQEPLFYEDDPGAETSMVIDADIYDLLPDDFFENPTKWIESQNNVARPGEDFKPGKTLLEMSADGYDISKVKEFVIGGTQVVSKRIPKEEIREVERAQEAFEKGIPTPRVLAEIVDHGNTYAWFEKINGYNLNSVAQDEALYNAETMGIMSGSRRYFETLVAPFGSEHLSVFQEKWRILEPALRLYVFLLQLSSITIEANVHKDAYAEKVRQYLVGHDYVKASKVYPHKEISGVPLAYRDLLKKYGESIESLCDQMVRVINDDDIDHIDEKTVFPSITSAINKEKKEFRSWFINYVWQLKFGYTQSGLRSAVKEIEAMCTTAGISHKDFAERNILVETGPDGRAVVDASGLPKLWIIDWEEGNSK